MENPPLSHKTEERLHAISHALGIVLGFIGAYLLLKKDSSPTPYATLSLFVYSVSVILLFSASTFYHLASNPQVKHRLRILDHISIYFLIAGTYSPVSLITLWEGNGLLIFCGVWGLALIGSLLKIFFTGKYETISLGLYLVMGWLIVMDFPALLKQSSNLGMLLLLGGGVFYTLGTLFYARRNWFLNHLIWHFFVLGGAIFHWFYIYKDVL